MKRFSLSSLFLLMFFAGLTCEMRAQDFYPLDSANTWSYRVFHNNYPQPPDSTTRQPSITTDTLMPNGHTYRRLSQSDPLGSLFVRVDSTHVHYCFDGLDVPMFNLRDTVGTVDTIRWGPLFTSRLDRVDSILIFGQWRTARYYSFDGLVQSEATLAEGFGIVDAVDWGDGGWPFNYIAWWRIRGCIIRDTTYGTLVDVPEEQTSPTGFALYQNYPNPFNPSTSIKFQLTNSNFVSLKAYNILGQDVATLVDGITSSGNHVVTFGASHLATGVYVYVLSTPSGSIRRKMMLLK